MRTDVLDMHQFIRSFDPDGMLSLTEEFGEQWNLARGIGEKFSPPQIGDVDSVLVLGMGGSAIAGDLLGGYLQDALPVPLQVNRGYTIPAFAGEKTLVIASSYSGNTAETLSGTVEALERGCRVMGITTGGKLSGILTDQDREFITIPKGYSPRAALGLSFVPLLITLQRLFDLSDQTAALDETEKLLADNKGLYGRDVPGGKNQAKRIASRLAGKLPVVYGASGPFAVAAYRWQCQINENAERMAISNQVAEMNHNEIVGWAGPVELTRQFVVVNLLDKGYHPEIRYRFECMSKLIARTSGEIISLESRGDSLLARVFSLIHLGDFVSVYLALLEGVDSTPVKCIDTLKELLAGKFGD